MSIDNLYYYKKGNDLYLNFLKKLRNSTLMNEEKKELIIRIDGFFAKVNTEEIEEYHPTEAHNCKIIRAYLCGELILIYKNEGDYNKAIVYSNKAIEVLNSINLDDEKIKEDKTMV